jgi:hypothetical protein
MIRDFYLGEIQVPWLTYLNKYLYIPKEDQ